MATDTPTTTDVSLPKGFDEWARKYFAQVTGGGISDEAAESVGEFFKSVDEVIEKELTTEEREERAIYEAERELEELVALRSMPPEEVEKLESARQKKIYESVRSSKRKGEDLTVDGRFENAKKHAPLTEPLTSGLSSVEKLATAGNYGAAVNMLRALIDLVHFERNAIRGEFNRLYDRVEHLHERIERDGKMSDEFEYAEVIQQYLDEWKLAEAAAEVKKFETGIGALTIARAKTPTSFEEMSKIEQRHTSGPEISSSSDALLRKAQSSRQTAARFARNTEMARSAATRIVNEHGGLMRDAGFLAEFPFFLETEDRLPSVLAEVSDSDHSELPQSVHMIQVMKRISDDKSLQDAIEKVEKPGDDTPAARMIRATLGLPGDAKLTDAHARQAVVCAMMSQLRQGSVGSCFATATAVEVQMSKPEIFVRDMTQLFKEGKISRKVKVNGTSKTIEIPLNENILAASTYQQPVKFSGEPHTMPGVETALDSLKIPVEDRKTVVDAALIKLTGITAALEKLPSSVTPEQKAELAGKILESVRSQPDDIAGAVNAEMTKFMTASSLSEPEIREAKDTLSGKPFTYSPEHLLGQIVLNQAPSNPKEALASMKDAYLGQEENRLIRAWEYSIASMVEESTAPRGKRLLGGLKGAVDTVKLNVFAEFLGKESIDKAMRIDELCDRITDEFDRLVNDQITTGYDPSVVHSEVSSDGSSSYGGYCLYHDGKKIEDRGAYVNTLKRLMQEARDNLYGSAADPEKSESLEVLAELQKRIDDDGFLANVVSQSQQSTSSKPVNAWSYQAGGDTDSLLQMYHGRETPLKCTNSSTWPTAISPTPVESADTLFSFLVDTVRDIPGIADLLKDNPEALDRAGIPVRTVGIHAFTLKPGSKVLREAIVGGKDGGTALTEFRTAERQKYEKAQKETLLTDELKEILLKQSLDPNDYKTNKAHYVTEIDKLLPSDRDATVEDFAKAVTQVYAAEGYGPWSQKRMGDVLVRSTIPPIPKDDLSDRLDVLLKRLKVHKSFRSEVKDEALKALGDHGDYSMSLIASKLAEALGTVKGKHGGEDGEGSLTVDSETMYRELRATDGPMGAVIADTNWGNGDHLNLFSVVVNPLTDSVEMWVMNEDGTGASKMDQDKWIKNTTWRVFDDPTEYGGVIDAAARFRSVHKQAMSQFASLRSALASTTYAHKDTAIRKIDELVEAMKGLEDVSSREDVPRIEQFLKDHKVMLAMLDKAKDILGVEVAAGKLFEDAIKTWS
ncbi:hypothetical protein [Maioricimonas sp. JC845]|uniref:hypothetical protein n=1 Tax=Maioricimonas sp. JC845 TaxID=3232138 RepID=UPI00345906C7